MCDASTPMKACTICGAVLPATNEYFYWGGGRFGLQAACRPCSKARVAAYNAAKPKPDRGLPPAEAVCPQCSKSFTRIRRRKGLQVYCSVECVRAASIGPKPERYTLEPITCPQCQVVFRPRHHRIKFCSRECASSWNMNPEQRGQGRTRIVQCETCGADFKRQHVDQVHCSHKCFTDQNIGPRNNKYEGYLLHDVRGYKRYSDSHPKYPGKYVHQVIWDEAYPDAPCAHCGGTKTVVHHVDENKSNNSLENLLGLCAPCHARLHSLQRWSGRK